MTRVVSCFLALNRTETGVAQWTVGVVRSNELEAEEMMIADVCLVKSVGGRPPGWVAPWAKQSCRAAVSMVDGGVHGLLLTQGGWH